MAAKTARRLPLKPCFVVWTLLLLGCFLEQRLIVANIKSAHVFSCTGGVDTSRGTSLGISAPVRVQTSSSGREGDATEKSVDAKSSHGGEGAELLALVAYVSAPGNFGKRRDIRRTCLPEVWEQCRRFAAAMGGVGGGDGNGTADADADADANADANADASFEDMRRICDVKFFVGQPNNPSVEHHQWSKHQGKHSTEWEIGVAQYLYNETDEYRDLAVIPMKDSYQNLPDKTLHVLREGALSGARIIVKIDDDVCPNMTSVLDIARTTRHNDARYVGIHQWQGDESKTMKGADGQHRPYMAGPVYLVSSALARAVAIDDAAYSVLYMPYGSSSEDVDMGRWYQHARGTHPHLNFTSEVVWGIATTLNVEEKANAEGNGTI